MDRYCRFVKSGEGGQSGETGKSGHRSTPAHGDKSSHSSTPTHGAKSSHSSTPTHRAKSSTPAHCGNPTKSANPGKSGTPTNRGNRDESGGPGENRTPGDNGNPGKNRGPTKNGNRGESGGPGASSNRDESGGPGASSNRGESSGPGESSNPTKNANPGKNRNPTRSGNRGESGGPGENRTPTKNGNPGESGETLALLVVWPALITAILLMLVHAFIVTNARAEAELAASQGLRSAWRAAAGSDFLTDPRSPPAPYTDDTPHPEVLAMARAVEDAVARAAATAQGWRWWTPGGVAVHSDWCHPYSDRPGALEAGWVRVVVSGEVFGPLAALWPNRWDRIHAAAQGPAIVTTPADSGNRTTAPGLLPAC